MDSGRTVQAGDRTPEFAAGLHWAAEISGGRFRYVEATGWWECINGIWQMLKTSSHRMRDEIAEDRYRIAAAMQESGEHDPSVIDALTNYRPWLRESGNEKSDMWVAIRHMLTGVEPTASVPLFYAANGVVLLESGALVNAKPEHGCRAQASGSYYPDDYAAMLSLLREAFALVLSHEDLDVYLDALALAMTGSAQTYLSLLAITGRSRTGKGGLANLGRKSFGGYGAEIDQVWLKGGNSEIDDKTAIMLERQVLLLTIDEFGGIKPDSARFNRVTGDMELSARKPWHHTITGKLRALMLAPCTSAPSMEVRAGPAGRLGIVKTLGQLKETNRKPNFEMQQELQDALITVCAVRAAGIVGKINSTNGYTANRGSKETYSEFLKEADPLDGWLSDLPDHWAGRSIGELAEHAKAPTDEGGLGLDKDKNIERWLGKHIKNNPKWETHQETTGKRRKLLRLTGAAPEQPELSVNGHSPGAAEAAQAGARE